MNLTGTYRASMHTPIGEREFTLVLNADSPQKLTGTFTGDHGTCEILWGRTVEIPTDLNEVTCVNPLRDGGKNEGTYLFFNVIPHDCDLTFFGVVQENGDFYGANFHKGHASLFSGKKAEQTESSYI